MSAPSTTKALRYLRRLIRFDSTSAKSNRSIAKFLEMKLIKHGFFVEKICYRDHNKVPKVNLVAKKGLGQGGLAYFGHMDTMAPSLASIHEVGAELPQECMPILAHSLLGPLFYVTFNAPSFQAWVDGQSQAPAYAVHRHFLEHLASASAIAIAVPTARSASFADTIAGTAETSRIPST